MSDALSQILEHLRLKGSIYFHTDFHRPWGIKVPKNTNVVRFHMAMRGECYFRIEGVKAPVFLGNKDLIVIPNGVSHDIIDTADGVARDIPEVIEETGFSEKGALIAGDGQDARPCQLICGHFEFDEGADHPILGSLPQYLVFREDQTGTATWFESAMRFMSTEIKSGEPGSAAVVHRLAEIIFIHVVRSYVSEAGDEAGMFAAVLDLKLSACLSTVHADPAYPWTVESMAIEAGMSRTAFAERFRDLVGMTPLEYVTHWRMRLARRMLAEGIASILDIAEATGYSSEASFNRAFKREFEQTPGKFRRAALV